VTINEADDPGAPQLTRGSGAAGAAAPVVYFESGADGLFKRRRAPVPAPRHILCPPLAAPTCPPEGGGARLGCARRITHY
jgi:hypothetical protein